jgi:hypothetical protein
MNFRMGLRTAAVAAALSSLAGAALASGSVSATAPASVTVLSPTTLTKTQDMLFGQVVRPSNASANTVTLDVNNTVTLSGAGNGSVVASTTKSAKFDIVAPAGTTYTTTQALTFVQTGLTNIAASLPVASSGTLGTVPVSGTQELRYGGAFDMDSTTPAQAYSGTLSVTVNYN